MKFEEVLTALREGKKIRRKDIVWKNYYGFLFISETENKIFSDNVDNCNYKITKEDLEADNWEIVEEIKKVKLRDLTEKQYVKWRKNNCCANICDSSCPFKYINCCVGWSNYKEMYSDKFLDQEIEVEEDDN